MQPKKTKRTKKDSIKTTIEIGEIKLKDLVWSAKLIIGTLLPKSYRQYSVSMYFNDEPNLKRIKELKKDFSNTLFSKDPKQKLEFDKKVDSLENEVKQLRKDLEKINFSCTVAELKYKDSNTVLTIRMPDDVIEAFNRQKTKLSLYEISLEPLN